MEQRRVLIVDDSESFVEALVWALRSTGRFEPVAAAGSGEEALTWLSDAHNALDVALVDLRMPGMGGLAAIPQIRALRPAVPIVANSAGEEGTNREAALEAGADAYCVKGDAEALLRELERVAG